MAEDRMAVLDTRAALGRAGEDRKVQRAAYHMLAWAAYTAGDHGRALDWFQRSLAVRQAMGDPFGVAVELANLGDMAMEAGDLPRAGASIREALATAVRLENLYLLTSFIGSAGALAGAAGIPRRRSCSLPPRRQPTRPPRSCPTRASARCLTRPQRRPATR